MRFLKILFGMALSGALLACGGGGGNASAPGTSTTGGAAVASVDVSAASAQLGTAVGDTVLITATVKDANNNAMANQAVAFTASSGNLTSVQTVTGGDFGGATAVLSAGADKSNRVITVTVTSGGKVGTTTVAVTDTGGVGGAVPTATVSIVNIAGADVTSISVGGGFSAKAVVKDSAGTAVANRLVTFTLNGASIATLTPDTALTDGTGVAKVALSPASINSLGAATLSASALVGTTQVSGQKDFAVSPTNLALGTVTVGSLNLPSGGNTAIAVTALIGGAPSVGGLPVNVTFSASCGRINGGGTSFSTTTSGNGVASAVYTAVAADGSLCFGPVTITAASAGATPSTAVINVAAPVANAMTFVSATPAQIFVAGSGALEQSIVRFKVLSGATPLANVAVRFSLQVNPGGVGLGASGSVIDVLGTTDASGDATVSLFSGTIPGPVRVRATLVADAAVFAESQNLTVASGPPSQRFMSLSVQTFNIEGWAFDGSSTKLTVRLADRQGNAVEDGTVVNFTAEGGQVAPSCATARLNGISSCSVDFISQNPRPAGGRVSVLAYASGTKDYVDVNGNNRYDAGADTLIPIGDAYRDDDENGAYDSASGEFVIPRGGSTACAGVGWTFPSRANTCDASLATTVRQQAVLFYSSTVPAITTTLSLSLVQFKLASLDNPLLPLPAGTTVNVEAGDTTPANLVNCTVVKTFGTTIPNIAPPQNLAQSSATSHSATLKDCASGDFVLVTVKVPSGLETTFQYTLP